MIAIGVVALRWQLCTFPLNSLILASNMLAQTCRKPWRANILAAARQGLFFIPLIFILPSYFGLLGVEMCQAVSDVLSFTLTVPIVIYTFREFTREAAAKKTTVMSTLYIKNMVCDRCKMAVSQTLQQVGLHPQKVELGEVSVEEDPSSTQLSTLRVALKELGFELLDDRRQQTIDHIKSALIRLVHYHDNQSSTNLSDYLSSELRQDYSALSKLFSEVEGKTIERYYIELRIERAKEFIRYDELTLTQIALRMNYSSVAYLSSQFKSVTGMTPSQFKSMKGNLRTPLDKL